MVPRASEDERGPRQSSSLGHLRARWAERRDLHRRAPDAVRRYRIWSSLQSIAPGIGGLVTIGVGMNVPPPYGVLWAWSAGLMLGNAAFLIVMAVPPRRQWVHRFAWWYSVAWLVISGFVCVPLLVFAIPCFACICDKNAIAWFCEERETSESDAPRLPHHPWGYERAPSD